MLGRTFVSASAALACLSLAACLATTHDGTEDVDSARGGLARRDVDPPPPRPRTDAGTPPSPTGKPPIVAGPVTTVFQTPERACPTTRYDIRRKNGVTCEAYGAPYVQGSGGRFAVKRLLDGTTAPDAIKATACSFTWEPAAPACGAPDTAALHVQVGEVLTERPRGVMRRATGTGTGPGGVPTIGPKPETVIPNGTGRCDVCGFASGRHMWAVLPQDDNRFYFQLSSYASPASITTDEYVVDVTLDQDVPDQDVTLFYLPY